jgi:hypothetical protein
MKLTNIRVSGVLATVIAIALMGAIEAGAQTANVAGAWTFTVTTELSGVSTPSVTLEQDGETLTGHYSSENLGEADLEGTVSGSEITFSFAADPGLGQVVDVVYTGTLNEEGQIVGTMELAGGLATGTFTAVRAED